MGVKLFVYGTLKVGGALTNKILDKKRIRVNNAMLSKALLYDLGAFPGVVPSDDVFDKVYGEVHEYEDEATVLDIMDQIEGYNPDVPDKSLFLRQKAFVYNKDTDEYEEVYFYKFNKQRVLPNKDLSELGSVVKSGKW